MPNRPRLLRSRLKEDTIPKPVGLGSVSQICPGVVTLPSHLRPASVPLRPL